MPKTPNHGYNVPSEGQTDWHQPLNENFEQYDTDIEIRDVQDNIQQYEPKAGAKFLATDTEEVFLGDGSRWNDLKTGGTWPRFERIFVDGSDRNPRIEYELEDGNAAVIQGVTSNGRFITSMFEDSGGQFPAVSATRDGSRQVGIGTTSPTTPFDVSGQNNWNLDSNDGDVRIGDDDYRLSMGVALGGGGAGACNIRAKGGIKRLNLGAGTSGHTVQVDPDKVSVNGDFDVSGNKNFTQSVNTGDGEKEVVYTASEAGTPHTEASGVAGLEAGRAEIALPDHFGWVTDDEEPLHVQTTPYSSESGGLAVVEHSTDRLVVEDLDGEGDYEFSYTVKGTREGQADKEVVREPSASADGSDAPAPADD